MFRFCVNRPSLYTMGHWLDAGGDEDEARSGEERGSSRRQIYIIVYILYRGRFSPDPRKVKELLKGGFCILV